MKFEEYRAHDAIGLAVLAAVFSGSSVLRQEFDLPVSAVSHLPQGRVFTTDQWADYLIFRLYPQQRVFFDGRSDFFGAAIGSDYRKLLGCDKSWSRVSPFSAAVSATSGFWMY